MKQSKPLPENRRALWGRNCALNSPTPFLGRPARYYMLLFWPGHLCVYLHDWETRASPVRTPPRILLPPLENLGLSCQGPATQTAPSGQGRNSERSRRSYRKQTLSSLVFKNALKSGRVFREDTDLNPWRQHRWQ